MPLLGGLAFGWDAGKAAETLVHGIAQWEAHSVQQVFLVDLDEERADAIVSALRALLDGSAAGGGAGPSATTGGGLGPQGLPPAASARASSTSKLTKKLKISEVRNVSVTVLARRSADSDWSLLVCLRGVRDKNYGKIFSQGGQIDYGETPEQAAVRELKEEAGVTISTKDLKFLSDFKGISMRNYVVLSDRFLDVEGPRGDFRFEVIMDDTICKMVKCSMLLDRRKQKTGMAWVGLRVLDGFFSEKKRLGEKGYGFLYVFEHINEYLEALTLPSQEPPQPPAQGLRQAFLLSYQLLEF
jgi:8-oxo-dGTP pyrophosphatase MutT (NUDIX family)